MNGALIDRIVDRILPQRIRQRYLVQGRRDALAGNNVYCPCCRQSSLTFLPGGVRQLRPHARCVHCGSLERHCLMWHFLEARTDFFARPQKVLHVAPERIFFRTFSALPHLDYVPGAKFGEDFPDEYPAGTLDIDLTALSFEDNTFDAIICSHVLEHIPDDARAMRELHRVLKPGGWAILQVPIDLSRAETYEDFTITEPAEREKAFGQTDHVRWYGRDYPDRLRTAGFTVTVDEMARELSAAEVFRLGVRPEEDVYFCEKAK